MACLKHREGLEGRNLELTKKVAGWEVTWNQKKLAQRAQVANPGDRLGTEASSRGPCL